MHLPKRDRRDGERERGKTIKDTDKDGTKYESQDRKSVLPVAGPRPSALSHTIVFLQSPTPPPVSQLQDVNLEPQISSRNTDLQPKLSLK